MNIILLGPPGAGKGTQAAKIIEWFSLMHIATGDIFRQEIAGNTELGRQIKHYLDSGALVPDEIVLQVVGRYIARAGNGFLLDGFPRNIGQAEGLEKILAENKKTIDLVLYIEVKDEEIIRRLSARRMCSKCGMIYNLLSGPYPRRDSICNSCGGNLIQRSDDRPEVVEERLSVFHQQTQPLIDYYTRHGRLVRVDGQGAPEDVFASVEKIIENENN